MYTGKNAFVGLTLRQFKLIQDRLSGKRTADTPTLDPVTAELFCYRQSKADQVILGIDPALRSTGYGVIRTDKTGTHALAYGTISLGRSNCSRSNCLLRIVRTFRAMLDQYRPAVCVVEGLFYGPNPKTAQTIGEVRGAVLATVAEAGVDIYEIAPRKVKLAIVGHGTAQKVAVAKMVQRLLKLPELPEPDAADALALALAYANERGRANLTGFKRL